MRTVKTWLATIAVLLCSIMANAHDFEVDGIYYNILSAEDKTVEVTYEGSDSYSAVYTGIVTIPNSVTFNSITYSVISIGDEAFRYCSSITSIDIPESVTSIGDAVCDGCDNLTKINISSIVAWLNLDFADSGYWHPLSSNPSVKLYIDDKAITELFIPGTIKEIKRLAFSGYKSLTSVVMQEGVEKIGNYAFQNSKNLISVSIPESVSDCGQGTFAGCSSLESINLPSQTKVIYPQFLTDCSSLKSLTCSAITPPEVAVIPGAPAMVFPFYNVPLGDCTLYVPAESVESYKNAEHWKDFGSIKPIVRNVMIADGSDNFSQSNEEECASITYTRTLSKTNTWNALYVPFEIPMTEEFLEDYDVAYFNDIHSFDNYIGDKENNVLGQDGVIDGMEMEVLKVHEGDVLNANYPYLIRAKNTDALNMNIVVEDATLYQAKETTISCSSVFMKFDVTGIYTTQTAGELKGEFDVYAMSGGGWKQALNPSQQLKPFRLYLSLSTIDGSPVKVSESAMSRINIRVQGEDTETSILETESGEAEIDIFDLSGRRVQKTQKGLYIVNGKKVIVK